MRRRRRFTEGGDLAEVPMSPLIDCVFLLLIFFLVTTIIKRKDKQIKINMPENTSSVAAETVYKVIYIGLDTQGQNLRVEGRGQDGDFQWSPIENLSAYLKKIVDESGPQALHQPLQIIADRETPFQKAIDTLDLCSLQGFTKVSLKTRGQKR